MDTFTTDQIFRLNNAIDWMDTFAEELFDIDDSPWSDEDLDTENLSLPD